VRGGGRVVTIVAFGEEVEPGRGITHNALSARAERRKLEKLSQTFDAGKLRVEIEDVLPLEEAATAHERVEAGPTRGESQQAGWRRRPCYGTGGHIWSALRLAAAS
jgi:NADPH2:quinone reductase